MWPLVGIKLGLLRGDDAIEEADGDDDVIDDDVRVGESPDAECSGCKCSEAPLRCQSFDSGMRDCKEDPDIDPEEDDADCDGDMGVKEESDISKQQIYLMTTQHHIMYSEKK